MMNNNRDNNNRISTKWKELYKNSKECDNGVRGA